MMETRRTVTSKSKSSAPTNRAGFINPPPKKNNSASFFRFACYLIILITISGLLYHRYHDTNAHLKDDFKTFDAQFLNAEMSKFLAKNMSLDSTVSSLRHQRDQLFDSVSHMNTETLSHIGKDIQHSIISLVGGHDEQEHMLSETKQLMGRLQATIDWYVRRAEEATIKSSAGAGGSIPKNKLEEFVRWDLMSNAELHIMHKLVKYLSRHLENIDPKSLAELVHKGYHCTPLQASQQEAVSKFISMDICSEVEWYKLAHAAWPTASRFLDVGANKGYLGSLFLTLWGGAGLGLQPSDLFSLATKLGTWKDSRNPAGYCRDGYAHGTAMYCPSTEERKNERDPVDGRCTAVDPSIRIISVDGSGYLTRVNNRLVRQELPADAAGVNTPLRQGEMWKYVNFAMSDVEGKVRFTKQDAEHNAGFEGGSIKQLTQTDNTEEVNMTSVDLLMSHTGWATVDLLKIDTEGNDNKVLLGAKHAIENFLGIFTFEGGKGITLSEEMLQEYDALGYSCYSTSRAGLFKWSGGCMKEVGSWHLIECFL